MTLEILAFELYFFIFPFLLSEAYLPRNEGRMYGSGTCLRSGERRGHMYCSGARNHPRQKVAF